MPAPPPIAPETMDCRKGTTIACSIEQEWSDALCAALEASSESLHWRWLQGVGRNGTTFSRSLHDFTGRCKRRDCSSAMTVVQLAHHENSIHAKPIAEQGTHATTAPLAGLHALQRTVHAVQQVSVADVNAELLDSLCDHTEHFKCFHCKRLMPALMKVTAAGGLGHRYTACAYCQ